MPTTAESITPSSITCHILSLNYHGRVHQDSMSIISFAPLFVALDGPADSGITSLNLSLPSLCPHELPTLSTSPGEDHEAIQRGSFELEKLFDVLIEV